MNETEILPDFIVIDGAEGGTGAAPLEFVDHIGTPLREGLSFARNCLITAQGFAIGSSLEPAAASSQPSTWPGLWLWARTGAMSRAASCFRSAASKHYPAIRIIAPRVVATQDPRRQQALDVPLKAERVRLFHNATLKALAELTSATGLSHPRLFLPEHIMRRVSEMEVRSLAEIYPLIAASSLIDGTAGSGLT